MFSVMFWGFKAHFPEYFPPFQGMFSRKLSELLSHLPSSSTLHTKHFKFHITISYFELLFKIQSEPFEKPRVSMCFHSKNFKLLLVCERKLIVFSCEACIPSQTMVTSLNGILLTCWRQSSQECVQRDLNERANDSVHSVKTRGRS